MSWADRSRIFEDTVPSLKRLKESGYKMGVVTNTSVDATNLMLTRHEIKDFFEVIVTREDVKRLKPDPEGILIAIERLKAKDFYFVGDLIHDSQAAKKAGGRSIIVNRSYLKVLEFDADYVVKSLMEIPYIIQLR